MPVFEYKARDASGKYITASVEAASRAEVARPLREKGFYITELNSADSGGLNQEIKLPAWMDKPNFRDISLFSRQFATVINAGLPIVQSLAILQQQAEKNAQQHRVHANGCRLAGIAGGLQGSRIHAAHGVINIRAA